MRLLDSGLVHVGVGVGLCSLAIVPLANAGTSSSSGRGVDSIRAASPPSIKLTLSQNPTQGLPFTVRASGYGPGSGSDTYTVDYWVRPFGGKPCAPTYVKDYKAPSYWAGSEQESRWGTYSFSTSAKPSVRGPQVACGWLKDNADMTTVATAQVKFTLRAPRYSLRLVAPAHEREASPGKHRWATYTAHVSADEPGVLQVDVDTQGVRHCASTSGADQHGAGGFTLDIRSGTHTYRKKGTVEASGRRLLVCGWIQDPYGKTDEVAHTHVTISR